MLAIKKSQKIAKNRNIYECKICDYNTCNKYDFNKHIKTIKHKECELSIKSNDLAMFLPQKSQESKFTCQNCDKKYKDYSGLWRHKKICIQQNDTLDDSIDDSIDESIDIDSLIGIYNFLKQNYIIIILLLILLFDFLFGHRIIPHLRRIIKVVRREEKEIKEEEMKINCEIENGIEVKKDDK